MPEYYYNKTSYLSENYEYVEPAEFYKALFPEGSFQMPDERYSKKGNGILVCKKEDKRPFSQIVYDDHVEIDKVINNEGFYHNHIFVFMAPVSYYGKNRFAKNADKAFAMVIDLDMVNAHNIKNLMYMACELKLFPVPSYIVVSGSGIHVYYVFDEPIPLHKKKYDALNTLKALITTKMWKYEYTTSDPNIQYQPITQAYRMPGSKTKSGKIVKAYKTGNRINIEDIISCLSAEEFASDRTKQKMSVQKKYTIMRKKLELYWKKPGKAFDELSDLCYDIEHISLEEAKTMYPDWYQRRIVEGQPKGCYTSQKHLYEWWKKRMLEGVTYGHRYNCLLVLVSYATRCNIPFEEVKKDAYEMFDYFESLTPAGATEKQHFHIEDIDHALSQYGNEKLYHYSNNTIEKYTGIQRPQKNKRNNSKYNKKFDQREHLEKCRDLAKKAKQENSSLNKGGRPKKEEIVMRYLSEHPEETCISQIARECCVTRDTVYKYLKSS